MSDCGLSRTGTTVSDRKGLCHLPGARSVRYEELTPAILGT